MKKTLTVLLALVLVIAMSVAGTMAYLTSSDSVTNTFTVGNVKITLDEADVNEYGQKLNKDGQVAQDGDTLAERVKANEYKLIPGHPYTKDPTIHVDSKSEDCWLFVKVEDGLAAIEADTTIAAQLTAKGWTAVSGATNVYAYKAIAHAGENISVFDSFTLKGDAVVSNYAQAQIKVTAYAVQADGFNTAAAAWTAASGSFTT